MRNDQVANWDIRVEKCQLYIGDGRWIKRWNVTEEGIPIQDINLFLLKKAQSSVSTAEKYAYDLGNYLRYLKKIKIHYTDVNTEVISRYVRDLLFLSSSKNNTSSHDDTKITYAALKTRLSTLKNFYDSLITIGKVERNPILVEGSAKRKSSKDFLNGIINTSNSSKSILPKNLKYKETRHWLKWYTTKEINDICSGFRRFRDKVIFLVSVETGMRIGEILGLKVKNLNYQEQTIRIEQTENPENNTSAKTGGRVVPISKTLASSLLYYIEGERLECAPDNDSHHHYLFLTQQGPTKGHGMTTRNYLSVLKTAAGIAGFQRQEIRTHSGRSTTIQRMLDLIEKGTPGLSIKYLEEVLGLQEDSFQHYKKPFEARITPLLVNTLNNITPLNSIKALKTYNQNL